jgi:hypothetical protein
MMFHGMPSAAKSDELCHAVHQLVCDIVWYAVLCNLLLSQVLYGATDLLSGQEFLHQLEELGRRSGITQAAPAAAAAAGGPTG